MWISKIKNCFGPHFVCQLLLVLSLFSLASCARTMYVYHPPHFDLTKYDRLGIITFNSNASHAVSVYATEQFQNQIHCAQAGIPILELGTEEEVLKSINAKQLDFDAFQRIGQKYKVIGVFHGNIKYSDIKTDLSVKSLSNLNASLDSTLEAAIAVKLNETKSGAVIWSGSATWKRRLGKLNFDKNGNVSLTLKGRNDAHMRLIPDMVYDVTKNFRGEYIKEAVKCQ